MVKGIVRGQVENTNLRADSQTNDVTAVEPIQTCKTEHLFGRNDVDLVQRLNDKYLSDTSTIFAEVAMRRKVHRTYLFVAWPPYMGSALAMREYGIHLLIVF